MSKPQEQIQMTEMIGMNRQESSTDGQQQFHPDQHRVSFSTADYEGDRDFHGVHDNKYAFAGIFGLFQAALIILYARCVQYDTTVDARVSDPNQPIQSIYPLYQDVHVMIFVGFGFLMTFLHKYSYGAVGFTFLVGALSLQWGILTVNFWNRVITGIWGVINITVVDLVNGDFAAGAVLISYGAIIGRVTPTQLLVMAIAEIAAYGLNNAIVVTHQGLADIGGTYVIHMFGAYFGLTVSRVLSARKVKHSGWEANSARYHTDIFAMIGTLFLWLYWPSFNGALAGDVGNARHRSIINTVLSIATSAFSSFIMSRMLRRNGKFNMVDVQNATLAGGVAMGCCANMLPRPWGAMFIGLWAGILSTFGFNRIQGFLERKIGLLDTCGVHNLHGMPSVFGAFCSVVLAGIGHHSQYGGDMQYASVFPKGAHLTPQGQALIQLQSIGITLAIAIGGGIVTAFIMTSWHFNPLAHFFHDETSWEVPETADGTNGTAKKYPDGGY